MPPRDKIRPWLHIYCRMWPECQFTTKAEFAALRHEHETGHAMDWPGQEFPRRLPAQSQSLGTN